MTPSLDPSRWRDVERHGDSDVEAGLVDFAVNVQAGPPPFVVDALRARLDDLAHYPSADDEHVAIEAIAALHGRRAEEVLLLAGVAEGFELLPRLAPRHAAIIEPTFTEPAVALRANGIRTTHVVLGSPWALSADARVPDDADLVIIGNPTNPTSVLHTADSITALRRPGRLIVVDEAFADLTLDPVTGHREPETLASQPLDDVIVMRSVTKTFGLAGLRAGYLLAAPAVIDALTRGRRPWAVGTLAVAALTECVGRRGQDYCDGVARRVAADRAVMVDALVGSGIEVCTVPRGPFVLTRIPSAFEVKKALRDKGFTIRSAANFVGLGDDHVRLAVRDPETSRALLDALAWAAQHVGDRHREVRHVEGERSHDGMAADERQQ